MTNLDSIKKQTHHITYKILYSQSYAFSNSHVWMWELDNKIGWGLKNWCPWTVTLENTLESPLDSKIKSVNPKGNQPWVFTGRTDVETEAPILRPLDTKSWLFGKTLMLAKIEGMRRRGPQRTRWLNGVTDSMDMSLKKFWEMVKDREAWHAAVHGGHRVRHSGWTTKKLFPEVIVPISIPRSRMWRL